MTQTDNPTLENPWEEPGYQAYQILRLAFTAAPILFGLDKFLNLMVDWTHYLAPSIERIIPGSIFMPIIGLVEIAAGILVFFKPRIGAYVVAAWLAGIVVNLFLLQGFYDMALRDFGLLLGALALGRLGVKHTTRDRQVSP